MQSQKAQSAPASHSDKFHALDPLIAGYDGFKHDVDLIGVFMEDRKLEAQKQNNDTMRGPRVTTLPTTSKTPSGLRSSHRFPQAQQASTQNTIQFLETKVTELQ